MPAAGWRRDLWLAAMIAASVGFSLFFACVAPLPALAAFAAFTLGMRGALFFVLAAWLANQFVGFAFLDYPLDAPTMLWGVAIGAGAVAAFFAARTAATRLQSLRLAAGLLAAVAVQQLVLFLAALTPLGGAENFSPDIVAAVFAINVAAFAGLCLLSFVLSAAGWAPPAPRSQAA